MIAIPGPTFPLIAKNFIELWTSWSLQIPRTPNPDSVLSKGPKLNLDLRSLTRVLWLNFFAASAGLVTLGTSAAGLSSAAGRSRRVLLRAPLVWVRQVWWLDSLLLCSRVLAALRFCFIITTAALSLLIRILCKKESGTFKKEKVAVKRLLSF